MQFRLTFQALECINQNLLIAKLDTNGVKNVRLILLILTLLQENKTQKQSHLLVNEKRSFLR